VLDPAWISQARDDLEPADRVVEVEEVDSS